MFYDCSYLEILGDGDKYKTSFYTVLYYYIYQKSLSWLLWLSSG